MRRRSLIAGLGIAFAGCTSSEPSEVETTSPDEKTTEKTPASPIRDDTIPIGESITYEDRVRVTVDEARLANTVTTSGDEEPQDPGDGSRYLLVHVSSTNVGESQASLASNTDFALLLGSEQRSEHRLGFGTREITEPVPGELYDGQSNAFAGVSSSGWLVYRVPEETEHAVIAWGRGDEAYWRADLKPSNLPGVQLTSVDVPESPVRYQSTQITLTIENTGGSEGVYQTTIGEDLYDSPIEVNVTVPGNETVKEQVTLPYSTDYRSDDATITIGGEQYTISYTTPTQQLGESFTLDQALRIAVYEVEVGTELRVYRNYSDTYETVPLGNDERWMFVNWEVENLSDESMPSFGSNAISLLDNGTEVGELEFPRVQNEKQDFRGTINDETFAWTSLSPGEAMSGYAIFRVPIKHQFSELDVAWSASGTENRGYQPHVVWEQ